MDKSSILLQSMVRDFSLVDCFKKVHPGKEGFTWHSGDGARASRIDYLFTRHCTPSDATLTPLFFTDHTMLSCTLSFPTDVTAGGGLWMLNCSLLQDEEIIKELQGTVRLLAEPPKHVLWLEMVKDRTRSFKKKNSKGKKREERGA